MFSVTPLDLSPPIARGRLYVAPQHARRNGKGSRVPTRQPTFYGCGSHKRGWARYRLCVSVRHTYTDTCLIYGYEHNFRATSIRTQSAKKVGEPEDWVPQRR
jgi:hypothetical protein